VLETGATWIGAWLDRMDYKSAVTEFMTPIKLTVNALGVL
jgi:hypothetical protein